MGTKYTPQDALTYTREQLKNTLDWVHEHLADSYGLEMIDGEEYLPDSLNNVMSALYGIAGELTTMCAEVGAYHYKDGELMRPARYSNSHPVYVERLTGLAGEKYQAIVLTRPDGQPHPVGTRRAGLHVVKGGGTHE